MLDSGQHGAIVLLLHRPPTLRNYLRGGASNKLIKGSTTLWGVGEQRQWGKQRTVREDPLYRTVQCGIREIQDDDNKRSL